MSTKLENEINKAQAKLGDTNFVAHVLAAIVEQEKERVADLPSTLRKTMEPFAELR